MKAPLLLHVKFNWKTDTTSWKIPEKDQTRVKVGRHHVHTIPELIKIIDKGFSLRYSLFFMLVSLHWSRNVHVKNLSQDLWISLIPFQSLSEIWVAKLGGWLICECSLSGGVYSHHTTCTLSMWYFHVSSSSMYKPRNFVHLTCAISVHLFLLKPSDLFLIWCFPSRLKTMNCVF